MEYFPGSYKTAHYPSMRNTEQSMSTETLCHTGRQPVNQGIHLRAQKHPGNHLSDCYWQDMEQGRRWHNLELNPGFNSLLSSRTRKGKNKALLPHNMYNLSLNLHACSFFFHKNVASSRFTVTSNTPSVDWYRSYFRLLLCCHTGDEIPSNWNLNMNIYKCPVYFVKLFRDRFVTPEKTYTGK